MRTMTHGGNVYSHPCSFDFSANINPLGMPKTVVRAASEAILDCIHYPDPSCRRVTEVIAQFEEVDPSQLLCGNGAADLIYQTVWALQPKHALLLAPSFSEYEAALSSIHCPITYYTLQKEHNFIPQLDFLDLLTPEVDVLFLTNPNNPTGQPLPTPWLEEVLALSQQHHIVVVLDECFQYFVDPSKRYSAKNKIPLYPNVLILRAFTKIFAIPGLRFGFAIAHADLLEKLASVRQSWPVSIPAQEAAIAAVKEKTYLLQTIKIIKKERLYLQDCLTQLGFTVFPSSANFLLFQSDIPLFYPLLNRGILIRDCGNFRGLSQGFYRIAVKNHQENQVLIAALQSILGESIWQK